jgi:hypothetical protein
MNALQALTVLNVFFWGLLLFTGASIAANSPNLDFALSATSRVGFYIYIPSVALLTVLLAFFIGRRGQVLRRLCLLPQVLALLALLPFLLRYTGGV